MDPPPRFMLLVELPIIATNELFDDRNAKEELWPVAVVCGDRPLDEVVGSVQNAECQKKRINNQSTKSEHQRVRGRATRKGNLWMYGKELLPLKSLPRPRATVHYRTQSSEKYKVSALLSRQPASYFIITVEHYLSYSLLILLPTASSVPPNGEELVTKWR